MRDFEETAPKTVPPKPTKEKKPAANSTDRAGKSEEKTCTVTDGEDG